MHPTGAMDLFAVLSYLAQNLNFRSRFLFSSVSAFLIVFFSCCFMCWLYVRYRSTFCSHHLSESNNTVSRHLCDFWRWCNTRKMPPRWKVLQNVGKPLIAAFVPPKNKCFLWDFSSFYYTNNLFTCISNKLDVTIFFSSWKWVIKKKKIGKL